MNAPSESPFERSISREKKAGAVLDTVYRLDSQIVNSGSKWFKNSVEFMPFSYHLTLNTVAVRWSVPIFRCILSSFGTVM